MMEVKFKARHQGSEYNYQAGLFPKSKKHKILRQLVTLDWTEDNECTIFCEPGDIIYIHEDARIAVRDGHRCAWYDWYYLVNDDGSLTEYDRKKGGEIHEGVTRGVQWNNEKQEPHRSPALGNMLQEEQMEETKIRIYDTLSDDDRVLHRVIFVGGEGESEEGIVAIFGAENIDDTENILSQFLSEEKITTQQHALTIWYLDKLHTMPDHETRTCPDWLFVTTLNYYHYK